VTLSKEFQAGCCYYQDFVASFSSVKIFFRMLKKCLIHASMLIILGTCKPLRSIVTQHTRCENVYWPKRRNEM